MDLTSAPSTPAPEAYADLWRRTLEQIPTLYGRLVYLTTLRNADSGRYEHHGLAMLFGPEACDVALRDSHRRTYLDWLSRPLPAQRADLLAYIDSLEVAVDQLVETWLELAPYRNLAPATARPEERLLFESDLEALLTLLRNELGGAGACPGG
jgi:hypothetical protein